MFPFSFLILLIWNLSLCPLVRLAEDLSIFSIFSKIISSPFCWFFVYFLCFYLVDFISEFHYFLTYFLLGVFDSFCIRALRYAVKLVVYDLSSFFKNAPRAMNFPLSTVVIVANNFGCAIPSLLLNSKKSLFFFYILAWVHYYWGESCWFSMCMWAFCCFGCYWKQLVHGNVTGCIGLLQFSRAIWPHFFLFLIIWLIFGEHTMRHRKVFCLFVLFWNAH